MLSASTSKERIAPSDEKRIVQLDTDTKKEHIQKVLAMLSYDIRKQIILRPSHDHLRDYRLTKDTVYDNKSVNLQFKKEITPEDQLSRGAYAGLSLDNLRHLESIGFGANYGQTSISMSHNVKNDSGYVDLSVGKDTGIELILRNYTEPIFKGRAKIGNIGNVSAHYDTKTRSLVSNSSFSYKGASLALNYMPQQRTASATASYNLPKGHDSFLKSVSFNHTYANGLKLYSCQANGSLGLVNFSAGATNAGGKYSLRITFSYSKKF
ncbi:hypothetical protein JW756_06425 [Candidatus Woesearchaeota archaeon]|nr:hypothetical protein [Candidatus Woesearchaeota archaeon]